MHGLLGDAESEGYLLPRPAGPTRGRDLVGFQLLQQAAKTCYCSQSDIGVAAMCGAVKFGNCGHGVSIC